MFSVLRLYSAEVRSKEGSSGQGILYYSEDVGHIAAVARELSDVDDFPLIVVIECCVRTMNAELAHNILARADRVEHVDHPHVKETIVPLPRPFDIFDPRTGTEKEIYGVLLTCKPLATRVAKQDGLQWEYEGVYSIRELLRKYNQRS